MSSLPDLENLPMDEEMLKANNQAYSDFQYGTGKNKQKPLFGEFDSQRAVFGGRDYHACALFRIQGGFLRGIRQTQRLYGID